MPVDLEFNYDEITSAMDIFSQKNIEELRDWTQHLDKSKSVPKNLSDKQLVLFYNACYGDMDKTKLCLQNYYAYRKNAPELFANRDLKRDDLKIASKVFELFHLSGKSCDGYEVIYHRLKETDTSKFNLDACCKILFMIIDLSLSIRGPQPGYIFLFDMQGSTFAHLLKLNVSTLRKSLQYLQGAIPIRMKAIHILNTEPIMDKLMSLLKPFMDNKFLEMIKFHNKNEPLEKLYEIVPRSSLPSNDGGTQPDSETLHKQGLEKLNGLAAYFKAEEEQRDAASPDKSGGNTFRQLDFD